MKLYVSTDKDGNFYATKSESKLIANCADEKNQVNLYQYKTSTVLDGDCYYGKLSIIVTDKKHFALKQY